MEGSLLKRHLLRPQEKLTFEQRLERAFPGSEWIELADEVVSTPQPQMLGEEELAPAIGVIGGAKFDEADLVNWLRSLPGDSLLVTTAPRFRQDGEPFAADFGGKLEKHAREFDLRVDFVILRDDLYGTYAKRVQIAAVLRATSGDVVVVGNGGGPDIARAMANDTDWAMRKANLGDRELVEIA